MSNGSRKPETIDDFIDSPAGNAKRSPTIEEMNEVMTDAWAEAAMSGITRGNLHAEVGFGRPVGREIWPPFDDDLKPSGQPEGE